MSVSLMTNAEMLSVLESWLGEHRRVFEAYPKWKVLLDDLDASRQELRALPAAGTGASDAHAVDALTREIAPWESRHDAKLRAGVGFLRALAEDSESADEAAELKEALRVLFPLGAQGTQVSYAGEAGNAARAKALLAQPGSKALRDRLRSVTTGRGKRTLLDVIEDCIEAGMKVGALDAQRTSLASSQKGATADAAAPTALEVRAQWLALTKDVVRMARKVPESRREGVRDALAVFEKAVERAGRRQGEAPAAAKDVPPSPEGGEKTPAKG